MDFAKLISFINKYPKLKKFYQFAKNNCHYSKWEHTLAVAEFGIYDILGEENFLSKDFVIAALMHDVYKRRENTYESSLYCEFFDFYITKYGVKPVDALFHGFAGAVLYKELAKDDFSEDIFSSIFYHSSGRENMSELEQALFVADAGNYKRTFEGVINIREELKKSLLHGVCEVYKIKIFHILKNDQTLFPITENAYKWSLQTLGGENERY